MLKDAFEVVVACIVMILGVCIMALISAGFMFFASYILSPTDYTSKEEKEKDGSHTEERAPDKNERKVPDDRSGRKQGKI